MAQLSQIFKRIKAIKTAKLYRKFKPHILRHFSVEFFLLTLLAFAVGKNLHLSFSAQIPLPEKSLFFAELAKRPQLNEKLAETYQSVNLTVAMRPNSLVKEILAASAVDKTSRSENAPAALPTLSGQALLKPTLSASGAVGNKKDVEVYQVRGGDTLVRIAQAYGVSVDTIVWENNLPSANYLKPGQELRILPVSGVKHTVKSGETIASIAKKYGVDPEDIIEYNEIEVEDHILPGEEIIIPNGVKKSPPSPARQQYLADLQKEDVKRVDVPQDYQGKISKLLIWPLPATGRISQYYWRRHRALDIPCRDCQIIAAESGIVELSGWQKGYGNTIVINHGNNLRTRYAHGKELLVAAGQTVEKGQAIMISGSTGRSTGPHLHFEIKLGSELLNPLPLLQR